ncbi:bacterio-opsin activator domain-containing protein [Haloglomus halophilum]|uniref:bacterio-opsin activator domain-containing protein n=1 Tax=Haloglomus halophilum TaxID=2962672 RepID=UPI0020C97114|nr:bacterio-opsin activator domain-containing protein [Haloglomus halophilum]
MADGHQQPGERRDTNGPSGAALLDAIPGPAFVLATDGRIQRTNEAAATLLAGDEPDTFDTLARPAHRERAREAVAAAAAGDTTTVEVDVQAGSGTRRFAFDCSAIELEGRPTAVLAVGRPSGTEEAEEQEQAKEKVEEEDTTATRLPDEGAPDDTVSGAADGTASGATDDGLAAGSLLQRADIVEAVGDGAYVLDGDRRLAAVSDRLAATLGRDRDALVGQRLRALLADDSQAAAVGLHEALLAGDRETGTVELTVASAGGDIPAEIHATAVADGDDRVVVGVLRDVSDRRRREHQLARHRDQLATLNRISEAVEGVVQGIVESATREGIEETVCERLAASDLYRTVWVGRIAAGGLEVTASAGEPPLFASQQTSENTAEADAADVATAAGTHQDHPARVAFRTGEPCIRRDDWMGGDHPTEHGLAAEHGIRASMALPITHNDTAYGVLCLQSPRADAFSDREQAALERLARVVGFAINAADTELLLHSGTTTELVFRVRGENCFLATLSAEAGPVGLRWTVPEDDGLRHFLEVEAPAEAAVAGAEAAGALEVAVVSEREGDDGPTTTIIEAIAPRSVTARLSDVGAVVQQGSAEGGTAEFTARIAGQTSTRTVVEAFQDEFEASLKAKRRVEEPVETAQDLRQAADERLTDRQSDVLRTAYLMGYFEWPRVHNAEEVAERMGITSATLHYHLRAAERNFLELFFDESPTSE